MCEILTMEDIILIEENKLKNIRRIFFTTAIYEPDKDIRDRCLKEYQHQSDKVHGLYLEKYGGKLK